jgi:hypothetical protein
MNKPNRVRSTAPIEPEAPPNPREIWAQNEDKKRRAQSVKENIKAMEAVKNKPWGKTLFSVRLFYEEGILCPVRESAKSDGCVTVVPVSKSKARAVRSKA